MAKAGSEVSLSRVPSEMHTALLLGDALNDLIDREPKAQVAIITREDRTARRLYGALHNQLPVRFVEGGQFSFKPGIDITTVQQVKGLEFDYVVIPDASDEVYPDDPASRRMLHVAATRAIHQLWVLTEGRWSQIVPNDLTDTPR
jgi:DNA helicase-2/ATP-dependent DNA helicase PcrA